MSMLMTTMLSQVLIGNKLLIANKLNGVESDDKLIEKYEKLFKSRNLKGKTFS